MVWVVFSFFFFFNQMQIISRQCEKQGTVQKSFFIGFSIVFQLFSEIFLGGGGTFFTDSFIIGGFVIRLFSY